MRSSRLVVAAILGSTAVALTAAAADFSDHLRALGREDDIRIDAQLGAETLSSASPITVTYQIENLGKSTVAVADKTTSADYDPDSRTITVSIGAEVPTGSSMPHMVAIRPGEKRVLSSAAFPRVIMPASRTPWTVVPRYVEIRVTLLRDVAPFALSIERQSAAPAEVQPFPDALFDRWVEGSGSIDLNAIPIRWSAESRAMSAEADRPAPVGTRF